MQKLVLAKIVPCKNTCHADLYNRQLHPEEKQVINELAGGDANKEHRLQAAACALVQCAAEYAPGTADYAKYSALQSEGAGYTAEQNQLKNYGGTLFSAGTYGGMVQQTAGRSLFRYSSDDAKSDSNAFISNVLATQSGKLDYIAIGGSALGASASVAINLHNGNVYVGGGGAVPVAPGASVTVGVIPAAVNLSPTVQAAKTDDFLGGGSFGGNVCAFGGCVGANHAIGGNTSVEVGLGLGGFTRAPNLGAGGSTGVSVPIFTMPGMQPKRK